MCPAKLEVRLRCFETRKQTAFGDKRRQFPLKSRHILPTATNQNKRIIVLGGKPCKCLLRPIVASALRRRLQTKINERLADGSQMWCGVLRTQEERRREAIVTPRKRNPRLPSIVVMVVDTGSSQRCLLGSTLPQRATGVRNDMRSGASHSHSLHRAQREHNMYFTCTSTWVYTKSKCAILVEMLVFSRLLCG